MNFKPRLFLLLCLLGLATGSPHWATSGLQPALERAREFCTLHIEQNSPEFSAQTDFPDGIALVFVRSGKVLRYFGDSFEGVLPKDWSRHFFLGLQGSETIFRLKSGHLLGQSQSKDSFLENRGNWKLLRRGNQTFSYFFTISNREVVFALIQHQKISSSTLIPLLPGFPHAEVSNPEWHSLIIGACLAILLIPLLGQFRICQSVRLKLSSLWLFFFVSFIFILFPSWIREFKEILDSRARREKRTHWSSLLATWEAEYLRYEADLLQKTTDAFQKLPPSRTPPDLLPFRTYTATSNGKIRTYPQNLDPLRMSMLSIICPLILAGHEGIESRKLLKRFEHLDTTQVAQTRLEHFEEQVARHPQNEIREFVTFGQEGLYLAYHALQLENQTVVRGLILNKSELTTEFLPGKGLWSSEESVPYFVFQEENQDESLANGLRRLNLDENESGVFEFRGETYFCFRLISRVFQSMDFIFTIKESDLYLISRQKQERIQALGYGLAGVFFLIYLGIFFRFQNNLKILQNLLSEFRKGNYGSSVNPKGKDEIARLIQSATQVGQSLQEKEALRPFLATQLLNLFQKDGQLQQMIRGKAVILFSDVRSFTTLSEQHTPEELVAMLNEYFTIFEEEIQSHGGFIEKFIGDAVVAVFFESQDPHFQQMAMQASIRIMQRLRNWNAGREEKELFTVQNGIGLSTGELTFGIIGEGRKKHFLSMGEPVHLAEELEALTKHGQNSKIFVDDRIYESLQYLYDFQLITIEDTPYHEVSGIA